MTIEEMKSAIAIFEKYINISAHTFHAEQDYLSGPHIDHMPNLTSEDKQALDQLGWRVNGCNCWEHYCSC